MCLGQPGAGGLVGGRGGGVGLGGGLGGGVGPGLMMGIGGGSLQPASGLTLGKG